MTTRYYEETSCEHGELRQHLLGVLASDNQSQWERCPGGSRRELEGEVVETLGSMAFGPVLTVDDFGSYLVVRIDGETP